MKGDEAKMWRHKSTDRNPRSAERMERRDSSPRNIHVFCVLLFAFCGLLPLNQLSRRALLPRAYAGDDWPQFRGPDGTGHSDARDLPLNWSETNNIVWNT